MRVKLPGTWKARVPPGVRPSIQPAKDSGWLGTHCRAALETIRSYGSSGVQCAASAGRKSSQPPPAVVPACSFSARASISGDRSKPVMWASGQRSASSAVTLPGPQPMSAIRAGLPSLSGRSGIRARRSRNGRVRCPAWRRYWCGSQVGCGMHDRAPFAGTGVPNRNGFRPDHAQSSSRIYLDVKRLHVDRPSTLIAMEDEVDRLVAAWRRERPDLDVEPLEVLSRVSRLARHLDRARRLAFSEHSLEPWEFDVLTSLRRAGAPYQLSPGQLLTQTLVTSGTMTNRIDRLAKKDLVERLPDPSDRRGVLVRLTPEGRDRADQALAGLLAQERAILAELSRTQRGGAGGVATPVDRPVRQRPRLGRPVRHRPSGRGRQRRAWSARPAFRGRSAYACGRCAGDRKRRSATALRPRPATMQRSTSRSRGVSDSTSRSLSVRCLRAAVNSRRTPVSSAGGRCVSSRSTPRITASSRCREQSLATQPEAPACSASAARRGSSFSASTTRADGGLARTHARDQGDAVDEALFTVVRHGARHGGAGAGDGAALRAGAEVGVDEHDVEPAALGRRALQTSQRRGTAAGRGDVDIGLGRQGGGERLGEDAVVVHHQDPDTNHRHPQCRRTDRRGYGARTGWYSGRPAAAVL